jgi:poly-gamma-glutamate synthesis protein (capsule biosynthesis protein)
VGLIGIMALGLSAAQAQTVIAPQNPADPGIADTGKFDPKRPLAQESATSVPDGFTLAAVGDCIISRPMAQYAGRDPEFAAVMKLLQGADVTYGNMETTVLDLRTFKGYPYPGPDDVSLVSEPGVAKDLAGMGFDLMSRANNHALDWGVEGMRETSRWMDEAHLSYAGAGENRGLARAPGYFESGKGRIAIVSMATTFRPGSNALPARGAAPARPGISGLQLKKTTVVTPEVFQQVLKLRDTLFPSLAGKESPDGAGKLTMFEQHFEAGSPAGYRYEMDPIDLAEILQGVRQGKQHSDFLLVTIHSHEPANFSVPDGSTDQGDAPAAFLQELAHAAVDSGADAFMTTGIHHLGPIEVYKGRPIFYGLADFFWSDIQEPITADVYQAWDTQVRKAFQHPEKITDADFNNLTNASAFANDLPFETVLTQSRFEQGRLAELLLYPVDLGYGKKLSQSGIPRMASAEKAKKILERMQKMSAPYGTKIEIENRTPWNYVGVVRPAAK